MFNYNHLHYFYMTAREGGVIRAANALKISQPSLSAQLKCLERETGKKLFIKIGRKLELTSEGQTVYDYCKQIFEISHRLSRQLNLLPNDDHSKVQVAVGDEIERPFAAAFLSRLIKSNNFKSVSLHMNSNRHNILIDELQKNRFDFLLTNYSADEREFTLLTQAKIPVYAVCSSSQKRRIQSKITGEKSLLAFFKKTKPALVWPTSDQKLRQELNHFLEQNEISLSAVFESNVLAAVVRAVIEDLGIGFLPISYIERELKLKQLFKLSETPLWFHHLNLICKNSQPNEPIIQAARASFEKMMQGLI